MLSTTILPGEFKIACLRVEEGIIAGRLISLATTSLCPVCQSPSSRVQSQYLRTVSELPWSGVVVEFTLQVRRFFCDNEQCLRKIFAERLPKMVRAYGRKTLRMEKALEVIAYAEGGEGGARTATELGMRVCADTLLNQLRRMSKPKYDTPKVLGVDEFAYRKGRRYGTILIDLERHIPVDLLENHTSESFALWLKEHPGVEIISRDRGKHFALGGKEGAPNAQHVADRFHLLQNLTEAIEKLFIRHYQALRTVAEEVAFEKISASNSITPSPSPSPSSIIETSIVNEGGPNTRSRRLYLYQQVMELHKEGKRTMEIARQVGMSPTTVIKYRKAECFLERAHPNRKLTVFIPYLRRRWEEGCHSVIDLCAEIKAQGYRGGNTAVWELVKPWRKELIEQLPEVEKQALKLAKVSLVTPSARQATFWLLDLAKEKNAEEKYQHQSFIEKLCNMCPPINKARELGKEFYQLVKERKSALFDQWIEKVKAAALPDLKSFAHGLVRDRSEVMAALSMDWNNGQTEGQVNRLKYLKRAMFGRAKFDLLKIRVLHRA